MSAKEFDTSKLAAMEIDEAMKSYLQEETDYSIIRRGLIDKLSSCQDDSLRDGSPTQRSLERE